ncbi:MAG: hypothetical protein ACXWW0_11115 [Bacteroidia bacterium]
MQNNKSLFITFGLIVSALCIYYAVEKIQRFNRNLNKTQVTNRLIKNRPATNEVEFRRKFDSLLKREDSSSSNPQTRLMKQGQAVNYIIDTLLIKINHHKNDDQELIAKEMKLASEKIKSINSFCAESNQFPKPAEEIELLTKSIDEYRKKYINCILKSQ